MSMTSEADALFERWRAAHHAGATPDLVELCGGRPDLLAELARRIAAAHPGPNETRTAPPSAGSTPTLGHAGPGSRTDPDLSFLKPTTAADCLGELGGFRVTGLLGQGGMGLVLRAVDPQLGREVAVKVIRPGMVSAAARERFTREARALAALDHPHVVPVLQVGEADGLPFAVMPMLHGESLHAALKRGKLPVSEAVRVGREMAEGLAASHTAGTTHRDIKPGNVWLKSPNASVVLLDFGLARPSGADELTQSGVVMGTPAYMAPEQADGETVDARADLFSLGCVLFEMLTGGRAFAGHTTMAILAQLATHNPPPAHTLNADVPAKLSELVAQLLSKKAADRPASAAEVARRLRDIETTADTPTQNVVPDTAPVSGPSYRKSPSKWPGKASRKRKSKSARSGGRRLIIAAVAGSLVPTLALLWMYNSDPDRGDDRVNAVSPHTIPEADVIDTPTTAATTGPLTVVPHGRTAAAESPLRATVDLRLWRGPQNAATAWRLTDFGAVPLQVGDKFRPRFGANRPAYLYAFWIDTEGETVPVYPWKPGQWNTRPADESPRAEVELPERTTGAFEIDGDKPGMETLLLVARSERWASDDAAIQALFAGLPPQRPAQSVHSAVWFTDGQVLENVPTKQRAGFDVKVVDDPVLRLQELMRERLRPHATATAALAFAKAGKDGAR